MEELQKLKMLVLELQGRILQLEEVLDEETRNRKRFEHEYFEALKRLDDTTVKKNYIGIHW